MTTEIERLVYRHLDNVLLQSRAEYKSEGIDLLVFVLPKGTFEALNAVDIAAIYYGDIRIMWSDKVDESILITAKEYNDKYNTCSFIKLLEQKGVS